MKYLSEHIQIFVVSVFLAFLFDTATAPLPKVIKPVFNEIFDLDLENGATVLDEDQVDCFQVSNVQVLKDFGPFREGETLNCLAINFLKGTITTYDVENNVIENIKFGPIFLGNSK